MSPHKLHFLSALPRIDGRETVDDLVDGVGDLVTAVRDAWKGPKAPPVRLLPHELPYADLPPVRSRRARSCRSASTRTPCRRSSLDFDAEPHFLVVGDVESGKSNLLRLIARGITERWTPAGSQDHHLRLPARHARRGDDRAPARLRHELRAARPSVVANIVAALRDRLAGIQSRPGRRRGAQVDRARSCSCSSTTTT